MPKQELDADELFNLALSIVGLVLAQGPQYLTELADHFGYSEKTIKKAVLTIANSEDVGTFKTHFYLDDDLLEQGEVDFSIAQSELTEPPVLSKRQATALAASLDYIASLPQFEQNTALQEIRGIVGAGSTTVVKRQAASRQAALLTSLQEAISKRLAVQCEYVNQIGERGERVIDPLRLDFVLDKHYLRGFCHKNQAIRSFRIDRMVSVKVTDTPVLESSLAAEIPQEVFGSIERETSVVIAADPEASEIFWNFPSYSSIKMVDGELVGEIMVGSLRALGRHIARYGGMVRVVEPPEAKVAVREFALDALNPSRALENED